ncbi:MAG: alpha/beta fold hydrolase [Elusimicrobia bacterium]|nr:alpha/beta fold hydrolase [Elusimicrobiota bacterium]
MTRHADEHTMKSWDGTEIFYRAWLPTSGACTRALLLFHRGHEHSARWQDTVDALGLDDVAVFAWDARGHGRSPGKRGDAPNVGALSKDADCFARHVSARFGVPIQDMVALGHSVGGVIAAAWVHDYAPALRGLVLATPALKVKLYVPFAIPLLRLKERLLGPGVVKSYVKAKMLTHDAAQAAAYQADSMIFREISVRMLLDLYDTSERLIADAGAIHTPTLMLCAGADWVVDVGAQRAFFDGLSSSIKEIETFPGLYHAVFHESERAAVVARVRRFLESRFAASPPDPRLVEADKGGYTKSEYDRLQRPGAAYWSALNACMGSVGRLSRGVQIGYESGFDSGVMLDYVYENEARGVTPLGRLIDRQFLDSIGWRGIRIRKGHMEGMLTKAIAQTRGRGAPVRIVDIAAGAGRYVLETLKALDGAVESALLRDYKEVNIDAARRLAAELSLGNVRIERGDAFDRASLAGLAPKPTIAIVSGLYELIPENAPIRASLRGLSEALEPGGILLYTNQPWHPQLEMIARTLPNREGRPWIMRRRTQAEMDALVREAGFEKIEQDTDPWGIFTVSLARRRA